MRPIAGPDDPIDPRLQAASAGCPLVGGVAKLLVQSKDGLAAACGDCIEAHAERFHEVEERRRRDSEGASRAP